MDQAPPIYPTAPPAALLAPPPLPSTPPARGRVLRRVTAGLLALQLPFVAAALVVASDEDGPPDLATAADRTEAVDQFRFAMLFSADIDGEEFDDVQLLSGEHAGALEHYVMDFDDMAESMGEDAGELAGLGPAMEMVMTPGRMYIRVPLFASMPVPEGEALPPEMQPLLDLGDRWGVIDLAAIAGASAADIASLAGNQGIDLQTGLDLLRAADGELESLGADEVRGTEVERYRTTMTFEDMLEAEQGDADFASAFLPSEADLGVDLEAVMDALEEVEVEVEVAIDDEGLVRRMSYTFDERFMIAIGEALGAPAGALPDDFEMGMAIEVFDIDDESIAVEEPTGDVVDLNSWAEQLAGLFGG